MSEKGGQSLQNVLSVSTAANNRYLLHFNTLNSLTQWTAGIRLSMYEHATLQEAYTGSLIAGKGKLLNNIRTIMERSRAPYEDWARVRFGAGTPWRRCWFVISPPDEKEYQRVQKTMKKKNPYDKMPVLKGDLKFYESKKVTKKSRPIATITHAYSAYAIYPQSKPLIDQSTLVKLEAKITIHSSPESVSEGFVFVMPETHPAVSGFEMMLRFLFPVWDTFNLYGRPNRLIADVLDQRGLMFAMPKDRRYGYLELLDVAGLIHTEGSLAWPEHQWRRQLKELTSKRMLSMPDDDTPRDRKSASRISLPTTARGNTLRFDESGRNSPITAAEYGQPRRTDTAPPGQRGLQHRRSASEANGLGSFQRDTPSRFGQNPSPSPYADANQAPRPPPHRQPGSGGPLSPGMTSDSSSDRTGGRDTPELDPSPDRPIPPEVLAMAARSPPPGPVHPPPVFNHAPSQKPGTRPNHAPDLRRGQSDLDQATLSQMAEANQVRSNSRTPPQADFGGYGRDPYASRTGNGPQAGYDDRIRGPTSQPGGYPADHQQHDYQPRSAPNYKARAPPQSRLQTIPASPYIQQDSPVTPHGTRMQQPDYFPQQPVANPAVAGVAAPGGYSRSNPDLRPQVPPQNGASGSDSNLNRNAPPENPYGSRDQLARNPGSYGSVTRKPLHESPERRQDYGQRRDMQGQGQSHPEWPAPTPYQQQYEAQSPYGQQGYPPKLGQTPMYQQQQGDHYPPQQQQGPPNAPMHGQLPVRGPPPNRQQYPPQQQQQQQQGGGRGHQWI
jgi:CCR4-NOT transcriptional complex subunit CAF120